jgi:thiol-disulfide isomerase/thioredoxin
MQIATTQMHFSFTAIYPSSQLQWDSTGGFFFFLGVSFWQYAKAATELKSHDEQNKELASLHGVQGFPTLKVFRDGGESVRHYNGPRDAQGIVAYLKQMAGPPSHLLSSLEEAEIIVKENPLTVV